MLRCCQELQALLKNSGFCDICSISSDFYRHFSLSNRISSLWKATNSLRVQIWAPSLPGLAIATHFVSRYFFPNIQLQDSNNDREYSGSRLFAFSLFNLESVLYLACLDRRHLLAETMCAFWTWIGECVSANPKQMLSACLFNITEGI